jgi:hypothetical protein
MVQDAAKDGAVALEVCLADLHPPQHQGQAPEGHHQAWAVLLVLLNREATAVAAMTTAVVAATSDSNQQESLLDTYVWGGFQCAEQCGKAINAVLG